jgi:hypothetical protein
MDEGDLIDVRRELIVQTRAEDEFRVRTAQHGRLCVVERPVMPELAPGIWRRNGSNIQLEIMDFFGFHAQFTSEYR